jgi:DNA-binding NarL/FixJ family response regulator
MQNISSAHQQVLPAPALADLTSREWQVLLFIADDKQNADIEVVTRLKTRSIINIRNRIGDKLMLKGRNNLGQFARKNKEALNYWYSIFYPKR